MNGRLLVLIIAFSTLFFEIARGQQEVTLAIANGDITFTEGYCSQGSTFSSSGEDGVTISGWGQETSTTNKVIVNGGTHTITLDGVNIDCSSNSTCAFSIASGATVNLILKGENTLKSGRDKAGLEVSAGATVMISDGENGSLTATGGDHSAGIGGGDYVSGATIIIFGGTVTATGNNGGAGIGGGNYSSGSGSIITIFGGTVVATGGTLGAGIGGGYANSGGIITISGGTVTATGGSGGGAGIGVGYTGSGSTITISGGTVTATGGKGGGAGIGSGNGSSYDDDKGGTFSTGEPGGNAFIIASRISDASGEARMKWGGVIFEGDGNGKVYGSPTLVSNAEIPKDKTLEIAEGQKLIIGEAVMLTNNGTLTNNGALINNGTLTSNNGTLKNDGILTGKGNITGTVTNSNNETLSAFPEVTININGSTTYTGKVIEPAVTVTEQHSSVIEAANYLLTYANNKDVGEATVTVTPKGSYYGAQKTATFTVTAKDLTVTPNSEQVLYADEAADNSYYPTYTYTGQVDKEVPAFTGNLKWNTNGKITQGTLVLSNKDNFVASNYKLIVEEEITFTLLDGKVSEQVATLQAEETGSQLVNGWYTGNIALNAPAGFKIKGNGVVSRAEADWASFITISEEGNYIYSYSLLREGQTTPVNKTISVQLDKTAPTLAAATDKLNYTLAFSDGDAGSGIDKLEINGEAVTLTANQTTYTNTGIAGTYTAIVTDKAGWSTEVSFTLTGGAVNPDPEPDPDDGNDPAPIFYTVTLPSIEGVSTDPPAGSYEVEAWDSFIFYLTLSEGYRKDSQPVVTTDQGETLEPRVSDGAYVVRYVRSDVSIGIAGIQKDEAATGMEQLLSGLSVRPLPGGLLLTAATPAGIRLFDSGGRLLLSRQLPSGETSIEGLAPGIYFLSVDGGKAQKVRVGR